MGAQPTFQFLAQFLAYLLTNNTNISFSFKTILINKCNGMEEGREVFQFLEQLALFQDQLLRPNGINSNLLKLLSSMEERREVFQFPEQPDLSQDLLVKPNGTRPNWLPLPQVENNLLLKNLNSHT